MHRSREEMAIQFSRFHTEHGHDNMGVWRLQRKIHKTELLLWLKYAPLPLDRIIPVIYQDGYDGRLVV